MITELLNSIMWLPKDERRLLAGYFTQIGEINSERVYRTDDLCGLLKFRGHRKHIREYRDPESPSSNSGDVEAMKREAVTYFRCTNRIDAANTLLAERGLITVTPHEHEPHVVVIGLTLAGYDLGRRYSNFLESSGLWFQEYKNHWIWLIVAFFGGALGVKLIDFIASFFAAP